MSPSNTLTPLHTTQFDEIRTLIQELRRELTLAHREEHTALRDSVMGAVSQLEER